MNPKCCWNLTVCKYKHSAHDGIHFCVCLCSFRVTLGIKETRENLEKMERKWVRYMAWRFLLFLLLLFYITAEKRINIFLWFNVDILPCFVSRVMLDHRVHQVFLALWVSRWDMPTVFCPHKFCSTHFLKHYLMIIGCCCLLKCLQNVQTLCFRVHVV